MANKTEENKKFIGNIVEGMRRKKEQERDTQEMSFLKDEPATSEDGEPMTAEEERLDKALRVLDGSSPELLGLKLATMTEEELLELSDAREEVLNAPTKARTPRRGGPQTTQAIREKEARVVMVGEALLKELLRRVDGENEDLKEEDQKMSENEEEQRGAREGVWTKQGTRAPNRLRKLLMKIVFDATADGFSSQDAFEMWRSNEEVRGIIASHYNKRCRAWSHDEWIDAGKARLRADGKSLLRRFGALPPAFPKDIMRKGKQADFLTEMMLMGGMELSQVEARDTKKKKT